MCPRGSLVSCEGSEAVRRPALAEGNSVFSVSLPGLPPVVCQGCVLDAALVRARCSFESCTQGLRAVRDVPHPADLCEVPPLHVVAGRRLLPRGRAAAPLVERGDLARGGVALGGAAVLARRLEDEARRVLRAEAEEGTREERHERDDRDPGGTGDRGGRADERLPGEGGGRREGEEDEQGGGLRIGGEGEREEDVGSGGDGVVCAPARRLAVLSAAALVVRLREGGDALSEDVVELLESALCEAKIAETDGAEARVGHGRSPWLSMGARGGGTRGRPTARAAGGARVWRRAPRGRVGRHPAL